MKLENRMKSRTVELVGFYYTESPLKGKSVMIEQKQFLPDIIELSELMNTGKINDYKIIIVKKEEDDLLYQDGYEFFNERIDISEKIEIMTNTSF
jgi:hypothetical protein